jgi:hypothetical protein
LLNFEQRSIQSVFAIRDIEHVPELFELPEQAKRGPLDFDDSGFRLRRNTDGRVARLSREHRTLAESHARLKLRNLMGRTLVVCDVNVQLPVNQNVKSVASPIALRDDFFARGVREQARVWPNLLASVVAPIDDHFQIKLILEMAALALDQLRDDVNASDGF